MTTTIFTPKIADGTLEVELDEGSCPVDAVYGAAFAFIDRCYVHLDRAGEGRIRLGMRGKASGSDAKALAGELQDELLGQVWRLRIMAENRQLVDEISTRALGGASAAQPAEGTLDDLLAGGDGAFEDPLGIAMSWEEKYTKKDAPGGQTP